MPVSSQLFCAPPPIDRYGVVYVATQRESGKQYVGQTKNTLQKRWNSHVHGGGFSILTRAIKKYGPDAFTLDILDWAMTKEELNHKERFWIAFLDTIGGHGYNVNEGGYDGKRHPDSIAKQSAIMTGRPGPTKGIPHTDEEKAKIGAGVRRCYADGHSHPNKGKPLSIETRAKISAAQMGRVLQPDHPWRQPGHSSWNKGKKMSPEHHIAHAAGLKRRYAEHPSPLKGRPLSPEHAAKTRGLAIGLIRTKQSKPVICVETGQIYSSQFAAAKALFGDLSLNRIKTISAGIGSAARRNGMAKGFHWKHINP